jgi:hypothetical protein
MGLLLNSPREGEIRHSGKAKREPESSPAIGGIQAIPDSRFRGNDGRKTFAIGSDEKN